MWCRVGFSDGIRRYLRKWMAARGGDGGGGIGNEI